MVQLVVGVLGLVLVLVLVLVVREIVLVQLRVLVAVAVVLAGCGIGALGRGGRRTRQTVGQVGVVVKLIKTALVLPATLALSSWGRSSACLSISLSRCGAAAVVFVGMPADAFVAWIVGGCSAGRGGGQERSGCFVSRACRVTH